MRFLLIALIFTSLEVWAHARLKASGNIPPRNSNAGLKTAPCGGVARTTTPRVLQAGATVTVDWEETINHPGRYEFYFSQTGDTGWTLLKVVEDTQNGGGLPHQYSTTIDLPSVNCEECTLQMIQVMTENPASPSLYYSCADIRLTPAATQPPPPTTGNPTNPPANCH